MKKGAGIASILLGGLALGLSVASYMYYKKKNDEETYKPVTQEDMKQRKRYFNKQIELKTVLMKDESKSTEVSSTDSKTPYSMEFMKQFFNTLVEGSVIGFKNVTKEYITHRRVVFEKTKELADKKDLLVLIQDFDKRYNEVIEVIRNSLIESLEIEEDNQNLSIDILLQVNKEFAEFYQNLKRTILKRCHDSTIQTNVNDEQRVFIYLKYVTELYKSSGDISDNGFTQSLRQFVPDLELEHMIEFKRVCAIDQAFSEWDLDWDFAVTWAEKWRVMYIGEKVEAFYSLIESDNKKVNNQIN